MVIFGKMDFVRLAPVQFLLQFLMMMLCGPLFCGQALALTKTMGIYDRVLLEPSFGYRIDDQQTNDSGVSHGPELGLRAGLGYENIFSAIEVSAGALLGFSSTAFPVYYGVVVGGRFKQGSPYSFALGAGTEAIYKARTQEGAGMPFYPKVKLEAQYFRPSGYSLGLAAGAGFFTEVFPGHDISYTPVTIKFFIAFPLESEVIN